MRSYLIIVVDGLNFIFMWNLSLRVVIYNLGHMFVPLNVNSTLIEFVTFYWMNLVLYLLVQCKGSNFLVIKFDADLMLMAFCNDCSIMKRHINELSILMVYFVTELFLTDWIDHLLCFYYGLADQFLILTGLKDICHVSQYCILLKELIGYNLFVLSRCFGLSYETFLSYFKFFRYTNNFIETNII